MSTDPLEGKRAHLTYPKDWDALTDAGKLAAAEEMAEAMLKKLGLPTD